VERIRSRTERAISAQSTRIQRERISPIERREKPKRILAKRKQTKERKELTMQIIPNWILKLSNRAFNAVARFTQYNPNADLNAMTREDFLNVRGIGVKIADEIIAIRGIYNDAN
jgi:DNA-directed RNA polymerase alpha subunit